MPHLTLGFEEGLGSRSLRVEGMEIFDQLPPSKDASRTSDIAYQRRPGETVDLREVLAKFWARKRFILASTVIGAALAFAIAKLITPTLPARRLS
jgi:hypothetical protein